MSVNCIIYLYTMDALGNFEQAGMNLVSQNYLEI